MITEPDTYKPQNEILVSHITLQRSGVILAIYLLILEIIFLIIGLVIRFPLSFFITSVDTAVNLYTINTIIGAFLFLVRIAFTLIIIFQWLSNRYEVYPSKLIYKSGFFWHKNQEIYFNQISKIDLTQGFFGRLFNFGTIELYTSNDKEQYYLYNIPDPQRNVSLLRKMLTNQNF